MMRSQGVMNRISAQVQRGAWGEHLHHFAPTQDDEQAMLGVVVQIGMGVADGCLKGQSLGASKLVNTA